ncbi:hypothetical protein, partial [Paraclostridium bifermentans]|uniref:hypothetical protein n=1 Tax=Paraclostridium bifermentans TaxID=1490 RepID=UPI00374F99DA
NNVTNNYNINLTDGQKKSLENTMTDVAHQGYDYKEMKHTLDSVGDNIQNVLNQTGQAVKDSGFFDNLWSKITGMFSDGKQESSENMGILNQTNNEALGKEAVITDTNSKSGTDANAPSDSQATDNSSKEDETGIFTKIVNWFKGLFNSENRTPTDSPTEENNNQGITLEPNGVVDNADDGHNNDNLPTKDELKQQDNAQQNNQQDDSQTNTNQTLDGESTNN